MYQEKLFGYYAGIFWATVLFNVLLPQLLWFRALRLNQLVVGLISFGVIVGMWCERFTIVVVSLHRPAFAVILRRLSRYASGTG